MSLYLVDKFIYQVDANPEYLNRYVADRTGFVAWWEREEAGKVTPVETVSGHAFTNAERDALVDLDIGALYAMGAHPFLLFTWVLPILEQEHDSFPDVLQRYGAAIAGKGQPSWRT